MQNRCAYVIVWTICLVATSLSSSTLFAVSAPKEKCASGAYSGVTGKCIEKADPNGPYKAVPAGQNSPGLEQAMTTAYAAKFPSETVFKITILDPTWAYVRHQVSGVPMRRLLRGQVAYKSSNGTCYSRTVVFTQENVGGDRYDTSFVPWDPDNSQQYTFQQFACDTVK